MSILTNFFDNKDKSVADLLCIKDYEEPYFKMFDDRLMDILQIKTKNLQASTEDEVEFDVLNFARLYKTYADDLKIIGLNFATDTKEQQSYLRHKINSTHNPTYLHHLQKKLAQVEWIERYRTDREYYLLFYSDDKLKYGDNVSIIQKCLGSLVSELTKEKKLQILSKINNKNTAIFV